MFLISDNTLLHNILHDHANDKFSFGSLKSYQMIAYHIIFTTNYYIIMECILRHIASFSFKDENPVRMSYTCFADSQTSNAL